MRQTGALYCHSGRAVAGRLRVDSVLDVDMRPREPMRCIVVSFPQRHTIDARGSKDQR
jgi:hypothetical protein